MSRRSIFDLEMHGIKRDPSKDYRWSDKERVDEHKDMDGYTLTKSKTGRGHIKAKGMPLMERSMDKADEERKEKARRAANQRGAVRAKIDEDLEQLSSKHGVNLHKYVTKERGDN